MSKPANPVETTDTLQDQAMQRSNTDNAPRSAIHQTLYSADTFVQYDYLAGKNLPDITRPQEGQINWLHFVGINDVALLKHALEPYGIHELVIEDILSRKQRPKIEDYGSYVFTAAQVYHYTSTGKLHSDQVYVIIGKDFVLSFESLDASRDMVLSMMDIYLSFQSNRMNQQMRVLTVITIIFMPLTVITGIYGMNFDNMPELHWHYGYFMVLGVMLCIIIGLLIFFSRRKWL